MIREYGYFCALVSTQHPVREETPGNPGESALRFAPEAGPEEELEPKPEEELKANPEEVLEPKPEAAPNKVPQKSVEIVRAICIRLDGRLVNNNGLAEKLGLCPLSEARTGNPGVKIEIEKSYDSPARRGIFGKLGFKIRASEAGKVDPFLGSPYKGSVAYNRQMLPSVAAEAIQEHAWIFNGPNGEKFKYETVMGSIVEVKTKRSTPTFT